MRKALNLTSQQVIDLVRELDGENLHINTLAYWAKAGIAAPSVQWAHRRRVPRVYNLSDLARVRLVVHLRAALVSMPKVRAVLASIEDRLPHALKPKAALGSVLVIEADGWRGVIARGGAGRPDIELPSGQTVLPLNDLVEGNEAAARRAVGGT